MKNLIKLLIFLFLVSCGSTKKIKENVFQHPIYPSCENVPVKEYKIVDIRVDEKGKINVLSVDAPHLIFEQEVRRVIEQLPLVKPGLLNGLPINVKYGLPITFEVR